MATSLLRNATLLNGAAMHGEGTWTMELPNQQFKCCFYAFRNIMDL
jgi:hypothetical protein